MKKYARLRPSSSDNKFEEIDNILYSPRAEISLDDDDSSSSQPAQQKDPSSSSASVGGPSQTNLAEPLQKLASFRDGGHGDNNNRSRPGSGRWGNAPAHAHEEGGGTGAGAGAFPHYVSGSGRWGTADSCALSGRWPGSTSTTVQQRDEPHQATGNSYRDNPVLPRSERPTRKGEWSADFHSSVHDGAVPVRLTATAEAQQARDPSVAHSNGAKGGGHRDQPHLGVAALRNISMRETQGWLASMQWPTTMQPARNAPPRRCPPPRAFPSHENSLWEEDPSEPSWKASMSLTRATPSKKAQSMRYNRLRSDLASTLDADFDDDGDYHCQSAATQIKAASMREGATHADAIVAMARAYSEKHGIVHSVLECVSCGRGLGVLVQGHPAGHDTNSFCQSCRPPAALAWPYGPTSKSAESTKAKRKGMMHYCRKILRLGKKPNKLML